MFLAPMVDDELREGLVEKTSVAKGLEPTLQVAAFDEPTQRFNVTVPLKHRASVASCPRDEAFINQQGPFHVRRRSSSTTTSVVAYRMDTRLCTSEPSRAMRLSTGTFQKATHQRSREGGRALLRHTYYRGGGTCMSNNRAETPLQLDRWYG